MNLPDGLKIEYLEGEAFIRLRDAAQLAEINPVALEMATQLFQNGVGQSAARFKLGTPEMLDQAKDIEKFIKRELKKAIKRTRPASTVGIKAKRDGEFLCFWLTGERPADTGLFGCKFCDKAFSTSQGKKLHERKVHPQKKKAA